MTKGWRVAALLAMTKGVARRGVARTDEGVAASLRSSQ